jgi:hypothetical protein
VAGACLKSIVSDVEPDAEARQANERNTWSVLRKADEVPGLRMRSRGVVVWDRGIGQIMEANMRTYR